MRIGIDFDNTIAGYDRVFPMAAAELGLLAEGDADSKETVRAVLQSRAGGETDWQRLQGQVYGRFMPQANLIDGVADFLLAAKAVGATVQIISHKTRNGHFDDAGIDLREAARTWMKAHGFFEPDGLDLTRDAVHFLSTRAEKVARIAQLELDIMIDDLPEVFLEPGFPVATRRLLFTNGGTAPDGPFETFSDWAGLRQTVFFGSS